MKHPLSTVLANYGNLSDAALEDMLSRVTRLELAAGAFIHRGGQTCRSIYLVEKGFARGFYYDKSGKELTSWFWSEGDILTSLESFLQQNPSRENIELIEPAVLYRLRHQDLQSLYDTHPEFNRIGRIFIEEAFIRAGVLNEVMRMGSAKEKYEALIGHFPQLLDRSHLKYIASFLGISPETLSRIRKHR